MELKYTLVLENKFKVEYLNFIFKGKMLKNDNTLSSYDNDSIITLVFRLRVVCIMNILEKINHIKLLMKLLFGYNLF
jgi:hypothetical protein